MTCSETDCENRTYARGLCTKHYQRFRKEGREMPPTLPRHEGCAVDGCGRPHFANGYCGMHAARVRRTGSTEATQRMRDSASRTYTLEERLWARSEEQERGYQTPCWVWTGTGVRGYGSLRWEGQMMGVHLAAFRGFVGAIPNGHQVHHLCGVRACWRPEHLQLLDTTAHRKAHHGHAGGVCLVPDCDRTDMGGHGFCRLHYQRLYRAGLVGKRK